MPLLHGGVRFPIDAPCPDNVTRLDHASLPMVADMHKYGIRIDVGLLHRLTSEFRAKQTDELVPAILSHVGSYQYRSGKGALVPFNIASPDHVAQFLFEELKIQKSDIVGTTPKGKRFSADDDTLGRFKRRHPVVSLLLEWRKYEKFAGTYTEPLVHLVDGDGFLHPKFNVTVVATGRLSASYIQTIPVRSRIGKQIRQAFIAPKGCVLVSTDLSQIEMRMAAHLSNDPSMIEIFRNGGDIHIKTACRIFEHDYEEVFPLYSMFDSADRQFLGEKEIKWCKDFKQDERLPAKTAGFGTLYENAAPTLQTTLLAAINEANPDLDPDDILTAWPETRCQGLIDGFYGEYDRIKPCQDMYHSRAERYGMAWDLFGRVRLIPEAKSVIRKIKMEGFRKAFSHADQGSSQGLLKVSMASLNPIMRKMHKSAWCTPALQVHDQIISIVHESQAREYADVAKHEMENSAPLVVPIVSSSDIGERWSDL